MKWSQIELHGGVTHQFLRPKEAVKGRNGFWRETAVSLRGKRVAGKGDRLCFIVCFDIQLLSHLLSKERKEGKRQQGEKNMRADYFLVPSSSLLA